MGSLTGCLQKAGKAINEIDKRSIIARAAALRSAGTANQAAATQAVDEQIKMLEDKLPQTPDSAEAIARADVMDALADLGDILSKGARANITPEQEQKLLPVLTRLFDAAFRLGFTKFKQASKWVLDTIREKLGPDVADALTIDHLQGAYITMSARYRDQGADSKRDVISVENKAEIDAYKETDDAPDRNPNLEPDSPAGGTPDVEAPVRPGSTGAGGRAGGNRSGTAGKGNRPDGPSVVPGTGTAAPGTQGNPGVRQPQPPVVDSAAGSADDERGDPVGSDGLPPESLTDAGAEKTTRRASSTNSDRLKAQKQAESLPVDPKSEESIRASLPVLLPQQQDDVIFALKRFEVEDGYGVLFTNGTGTGKTFSGLGIAKIYAKQGKGNILVVAPNQEVIDAWVGAGPMVGLNVTQLRNTKDMGTGVVVTTFANLKDNNALVRRPWDMMIVDEAQNLSANAEGDVTDALEMVNALMLHPAGVPRRTRALHPELYDKIMEGNDRYKKAEKQKDRVLMNAIMREMEPFQREWSRYLQQTRDVIDAAQGKTRPRAVMLSATPFAYEKSVKFAQGYLFDWNKGYVDSQAYNAGSPYQQFMMRHFGYRMRNGKLNMPDPKKVDTGLLQRRFNSWLREEGSLSGRMLDVDADYDRRFVAAHSEVGTRIDQAFQWFWDTKPADLPGLPFDENGIGGSYEQQVGSAMHVVRGALMARFDYRSRMRLLEALKAEAAIPYIRESLRMGRKVVVFHDLIKGQVLDPFNVSFDPLQESEKTKIAVWEKWKTLFPDLADFDFKSLKTPIQTLKEAFGEDAFELNGPNGKKANAASLKALNDDARGPMVLIVQSDKEAGWSGHDTTGRYPRVIVNLGLPVRPTRSIQQEGRIYRVGQVSDAMFRYFNTQTAWEQAAFANTMARRASTAENLAMGEQARGLLDAYIEAFVDTDEWTPGFEGEGTGGKQRDRDMAKVISEFDLAKTLYWAGQKKTQRDKGQEGKDYFATPEPLGLKMVQWLDLRPGESAIEPSGGHGAIARWLPDTVDRLAVEPSPKLNARLALAFNGKVRQHTFEELDQINKADGMAMNPPFGVGGKLAIEHLDKAYNQHLKVGGRIAVLIPEGPSADARFDKWFGGSHEKPTTVLGTIQVDRSDKRELRRGDTIYTKLAFAKSGKLLRSSDYGGYWLKVAGQSGETHITPDQIIDVTSDGALKETVQSAPGAHIVATIRLPRATFGRAGTEVASRIVIIDKLAKDQVAPSEEISWDFSGLDSAEALFDTIENLVVPERTKPRPVDAEDEGIAAEGPEKEKEKPKPVDPLKTDAKDGEQAAADAGLKIIDYTTAKGKNLRVYVAEHLTREQADEIEGMAWKPKGAAGWYIKTKNIPAMLGKYPPPSAPLLSEGPGSGVDFKQAKAAVAHVMKGWAKGENMPKVEVVQTAFDLPPDIFGWLNSMRADQTARGLMMPDGRVFLMADKFDDIEGVQRTLFHEVYGHFGMRVFLGDKYASTMALLRMANPKLAAEANDWFASLGQKQINARVKNGMDRESAEKIVRILAVEEALADRAGDNAAPSGWKMVMARIQKWLRERGMVNTANWLESKTEAETFALLMNARKVVKAPHINQIDGVAPVLSEMRDAAPALSQAIPAAAPAAPALQPSTGLLDAAARLSVGRVSKITGPAYDGLIDMLDRSLSLAFKAVEAPLNVFGLNFTNTYEYAKAGLVDQYGLDPNHSEAKTAMKTAIRVNARKTKEVVDKLQALTRAESRVAYLWMSDKAEDTASERALFDQLPESSRDLLTSLKADIEHLGDEAVELGLISHDVRQRNAMAYLHRSYEKYENQDPLARTTRARAVSILGEQFKGRGMRDDAGMDRIGTSDWWQRKTNGSAHDPSLKGKKFHRLELRKLPDDATPQMFDDENGKKLGRLQKVMYWPVDEAIPPQYADWRVDGAWEARWFNKADKVGMFRDFTLAERTKMGEIQEVKYAVATTMLQMVRDVETARFLDWVARNEAKLDASQLPAGAKVVNANERLTRSFLKNEWVQVPDSLVPGTGVKRFGNLGGRFITGPVWNDIRQISSMTDQGDLSAAYQSILRAWKISKTALSPVTHMNNVMSNFMMADAHDIQARHIYAALKAWATHKSDPEAKRLIEDYQDNGGDAGMFNEAEVRSELFQPLLDELRGEIEKESGTALVTAAQVLDLFQHRQFRQAFAAIGQTRAASFVTWAPKKLIKLYGVEDEVFRLAAFVKARADGVSDHDAGKFARDSFLNYEITAPWINAARRSAWPFAAFSYRAIPMMLNVAAHRPHKVAKYMALGAALNWMAYAMLGDADDEDRERAFMADEKAGRIWGFLTPKLVRMPWNDKNGSPVFLDIRRWVPGGDIVDMGQSQSAIPIPPPLIPGGPAVLAAEVLLNTSLFTGQDITQRTDTLAEKFGKSADFMWKGVAPNFPGVPGTWATAALSDAARGKVNPGPFGEEASSMGQALISGIGIKVRSYPTGSLMFNAQAKASALEKTIREDLRRDQKLMLRRGMTEAEFMDRAARAQAKVIEIRRDLQEKAKRAGIQ